VVDCASLQRLSCVAFPAAASTSAARRMACSLSLAMAHSQRYTSTTTTQLLTNTTQVLLPFLMPPPRGAAPLSPPPNPQGTICERPKALYSLDLARDQGPRQQVLSHQSDLLFRTTNRAILSEIQYFPSFFALPPTHTFSRIIQLPIESSEYHFF
jgi:hypothetical protein